MKEKQVEVGSEAIADGRWVVIVEVSGNDVSCIDEDGDEFEIDVDLIDPIISIKK